LGDGFRQVVTPLQHLSFRRAGMGSIGDRAQAAEPAADTRVGLRCRGRMHIDRRTKTLSAPGSTVVPLTSFALATRKP
jgi:hypothetical protein